MIEVVEVWWAENEHALRNLLPKGMTDDVMSKYVMTDRLIPSSQWFTTSWMGPCDSSRFRHATLSLSPTPGW